MRRAETAFVLWVAHHDADAAAGGTDVWRLDLGRTLCNALRARVFLVNVFLREHGVVTRVVHRHAVYREANLVGTKAANRDAAAEEAGGVVAKGIDARQQRDRLERIACGLIFFGRFLGHRAACFDGVLFENLAGTQFVALANDGDRAETNRVVFGARRVFVVGGWSLGKRARDSGAGEGEAHGAS